MDFSLSSFETRPRATPSSENGIFQNLESNNLQKTIDCLFTNRDNSELVNSLLQVNESVNDFDRNSHIFKSVQEMRKGPIDFPSYKYENRKGTVSIGNCTYHDKFCQSEFAQLLYLFFNSQTLLTSQNLSSDQVKQKRLLLGFLVTLVWGVSDPIVQAQLAFAIEEKIKKTNILPNHE